MNTVITILLYFIILYTAIYYLIPEILIHLLGIGSWKRQYSPGVVLSFDDGPDPAYTPRILNFLQQNQLKACFFLVGDKAEKYPEIVRQIEREGHLIGSHGSLHEHSWLMSPLKTWALWDRSLQQLKGILGYEPVMIRPPWGAFHLALFLWCKVRKKRIVGWNVKGYDWKNSQSSKQIIERILSRTREGSIILLHDSGGEAGAPENTLAALEELCRRIKLELKLPIVQLEFPEWSLSRRLSFRVWEIWERIYARLFHLERIDDHNLFRVSVSAYSGPDLYNEDGVVVACKGDKVGEIHFDNIRFQSVGSDLHKAGIRALKQVRRSLPDLVEFIGTNPAHQDVKVYIGVTMLNKGAKGLGFTVQEYSDPRGRWIGIFQKILLQVYHPAGRKRNTDTLGNRPKIVWISKDKLIKTYDQRTFPALEKLI